MTKEAERREHLNKRIRKQKGLIKEQRYNEIKKEVFEALADKAAVLEEKAVVQNAAVQNAASDE